MNKKALAASGLVISLIIMLVLVALSIFFIGMKLYVASNALQGFVGDKTCEFRTGFKGFGILEFKQQIYEASSKSNALYDPQEAIDLFKTYFACKEADKFDSDEIKANEKTILACVEASFLNRAKKLDDKIKEGGLDKKYWQNKHAVVKKDRAFFLKKFGKDAKLGKCEYKAED